MRPGIVSERYEELWDRAVEAGASELTADTFEMAARHVQRGNWELAWSYLRMAEDIIEQRERELS